MLHIDRVNNYRIANKLRSIKYQTKVYTTMFTQAQQGINKLSSVCNTMEL